MTKKNPFVVLSLQVQRMNANLLHVANQVKDIYQRLVVLSAVYEVMQDNGTIDPVDVNAKLISKGLTPVPKEGT